MSTQHDRPFEVFIQPTQVEQSIRIIHRSTTKWRSLLFAPTS
jgi:hypothetical protein